MKFSLGVEMMCVEEKLGHTEGKNSFDSPFPLHRPVRTSRQKALIINNSCRSSRPRFARIVLQTCKGGGAVVATAWRGGKMLDRLSSFHSCSIIAIIHHVIVGLVHYHMLHCYTRRANCTLSQTAKHSNQQGSVISRIGDCH